MTNEISIEQLKDKTIGELLELVKQAENLPEGFKVKLSKPKTKTAQELLEEIDNDKEELKNDNVR